MPIYKAPNNDTFRVESEEQLAALPAGCVEITEDELQQIVAARIAANVPSHAELITITLAKARAQRLPIMSVLDGMQVSALVSGDTPGAQAIETAKQGLRNITNTDLSACTTQAEMEQAIYQAYLAIAAAAPASVQSAFQSLVP